MYTNSILPVFFSIGVRRLHPRIFWNFYEEMYINSICNRPIGLWCNNPKSLRIVQAHLAPKLCLRSITTHWSHTHHVARLLAGENYFSTQRNFGYSYEQKYTNFNQFYLFQFFTRKLIISHNCASTSCFTSSPSFNRPSTGASCITLRGC